MTLLSDSITKSSELFIKQKKNWAEIVVDFETANRYAIMDESGQTLGMIAEE